MVRIKSFQIFIVCGDQPTTVKLRDCVRRLGYDVGRCASSGDDACHDIQPDNADLVLIDLNLTGPISGMDLAKRLIDECRLPAVLFTSDSNPKTNRPVEFVDGIELLTMPFEEPVLLATLELTLHHYRADKRLRDANAALEKQVQERTALFDHVNQRLAVELKRKTQVELKLKSDDEPLWMALSATGQGLWDWDPETADIQLRQFQQAVESANTGMLIVDADAADNPITYVNQAFCQMTGYSQEESIGRNCRFLSRSDRDQPGLQLIRQAVAERRSCHVTLRNYRKNGTLLWNELSIAPIIGSDGKVTHFVGILQDITARKVAEDRISGDLIVREKAEEVLRRSNEELERLVSDRTEMLRESEERLRIFIENVPAGVAMFDCDMRFLAYSNRWKNDYRIGDRDVLGQTYYEVFPEFADRMKVIHRECLTGVSQRSEQDRVVLAGGSVEYFRWEIQPWRNSSGVVGGLIIFSEMITQQLLSQLALRESEDRFRQIATSINHIFWIYSWPDETFLYVSPAFEAIFCRSVSELYANSRSWLENVHVDDQSRIYEQFEDWIRAPVERDEEFRIVRRDGEERWINIRGMTIRKVGEGKYRIAGVAEDITEKKQMQMRILQSQKLQAVGQLAGGIVHDFNNFLLPIACCSEQLLEQLAEDDPKRNAVISIRDAGARAAGLVRQLLAFTRKQVLGLQVVDLNEFITHTVQMMKNAIKKNLTVTLALSTDAATIKADPTQIDQVLLNLILNSQDAMPDGGQLTIETFRLTIDGASPFKWIRPGSGQYIQLSVSDTGVGMTNEIKSRIFEPYFTTKQAGKGTGLGMAVVHGIVSQCGGFIHIDSTLGVGSKIEILFPYVDADVVAKIPQNDLPQTFAGFETILLVEDDADVRKSIKNALESYGYNVIEAAHGHAAIAAAIRHTGPIHLLLTDIVIPEMSGSDIADALHAESPDLPVLFISGFADDELFQQATLRESDSFLQKPFGMIELVLKVRELLDRQSKQTR